MLPSWCLLSAGSLIVFALLAPAITLPPPNHSSGRYDLVDSWQGENFFDNFDFFTGEDPSNGFVTYLDRASAENTGIIGVKPDGSVFMGVDSTTVLNPNGPGRNSVRVESKKVYDHGLFIADLKHMPSNACGVWPAFWTVGSNWPTHGEIDIVEAVNLMTNNKATLHTSGSCPISASNMGAALASNECAQGSGSHNAGCVVGDPGTFGTPFNNAGGGVYAMELTDNHIAIWFFPRGAAPASIANRHLDSSSLGTPMALFQGSCNLTELFNQQMIVFDTTFCGDWAGRTFAESGCSMNGRGSSTQSCVDYVASHASDYDESFWEINAVKVFQSGTNPGAFTSAVVCSSSVPKASSTEFPSAPRSGFLVSQLRRSAAVVPSNVTGIRSSLAPAAPTPSSRPSRFADTMTPSLVISSSRTPAALVQSSQFITPNSTAPSSKFVSSTPTLCARNLGPGDVHCTLDAATSNGSGTTFHSDPSIITPSASTGVSLKVPADPPADPPVQQPADAPADPPADPPGNTPLGPLAQQAESNQPAGHPAGAPASHASKSDTDPPLRTITTHPPGAPPSNSIPITNGTSTLTSATPEPPIITGGSTTSMSTVPATVSTTTLPAHPPRPVFTGAGSKLSSVFSGMLHAAAAAILI